MTALAETSLGADERALLERFVEELRARLEDKLQAVWLFGSQTVSNERHEGHRIATV